MAVEYINCKGVTTPNECPGTDIKPSTGDAPALEIWFGLVWFYDTSKIVGYLKPNPFLYI